MRRFPLHAITLLPLLFSQVFAEGDRAADERLCFQTLAPWLPRTNIDADVAIIYGIDPTMVERLKSWRSHGYGVHVMTGVSWGAYQDFTEGRFDGKRHDDEAQTDKDGKPVIHHSDIPYMSPSAAYGSFLAHGVKRAIDAGAAAIHLEEPEFWVRGGYEANFQREWQVEYGEPWQPPHSSPDAQWRASKLKYALFRRALTGVFTFVHECSAKSGRKIPCYVPTHSLLNYAHWRIVSLESSLIDVGCDGYIAQVWTGTARTSNVYEGEEKQRTFDTAFLEYGAMQNLVRASGRRIWYLNDPIEDNLNRSFEDYRRNWENTLTASLLQPEVWRYEIMPWPERVFLGKDFMTGVEVRERGERARIPKSYELELQAVVHALGEMKQPNVHWERCGTRGVGVLVSDTMMFQRGEPSPGDPHLGSFYGLALPLLKHGVPLEPVQIESAAMPGFLDAYRLLFLTYEGQKPLSPDFHDALTAWVRKGGALVVVDDDSDPYNAVREWWNTEPNHFRGPREHLFKTLGIEADARGISRIGEGVLLRETASPAALTYEKDGAERVRALARKAAEMVKLPWSETNALVLRRGPFVVAAGLDESLPIPSASLTGRFVDLFDARLPIVSEVKLAPGRRTLLLDLNVAKKLGVTPHIVAAACRTRDEISTPGQLTFRADGIAESNGVACILSPRAPLSVSLDDKPVSADAYEFDHGVLRIRFPNSAEGVRIDVRFLK